METETMLGTKEVAARLKIEPRYLRAMLRKIHGKAPGERYEWKPTDPFLKKLPELIKAEGRQGQGEEKLESSNPHRPMWVFL
jgi:hypothetical protein